MKVCPHCSSSEIDKDPTRGATVCMGCGSVLEDQIIVSEVQFAENAGGGSSVIGQYVGSEGSRSLSVGGGAFHPGLNRESRAITLQNGKKKIQQLGAQLKLNQHCTDTAFNFFKMAVYRRLTRGRRTVHVVAACLYLVCRTEGTPHMLLDFSDILQINVYVLGKTYLHLARLLCINVPAIDPCLLIHRFAHRLEFGDKEHEVSMAALRLVSRMKRDWMATGRRPSGLCGAALLVAARIYNFSRTMKEIICVVKVCENTLKKRLLEFEDTASSQLTVDEFQRIDLEEEADPPAFTMSKRKAKQSQLVAEADDSEDEDDAEVENEKSLDIGDYSGEISCISKEIDKAIETKAGRQAKTLEAQAVAMVGGSSRDEPALDGVAPDSTEDAQAEAFIEKEILKESMQEAGETAAAAAVSSNLIRLPTDGGRLLSWCSTVSTATTPAAAFGPRPTAASLGIVAATAGVSGKDVDVDTGADGDALDANSGELDLTGINEDEISQFIMNEEEVEKKTIIWMELNADYLKEQEEKEKREAEEREQGILKPESRKKRKFKKRVPIQANTAGEAIEKIMLERKISSKINYEVLKDLTQIDDSKQKTMVSALSAAPGSVSTAVPVCMDSPLKKPADAKIQVPSKIAKVSFEDNGRKPGYFPMQKLPAVSEIIVESGPVVYDADGDNDDEGGIGGGYDDGPVSAAHLLGHGHDEEDAYGDDYDD